MFGGLHDVGWEYYLFFVLMKSGIRSFCVFNVCFYLLRVKRKRERERFSNMSCLTYEICQFEIEWRLLYKRKTHVQKDDMDFNKESNPFPPNRTKYN